MGGNFLLAAGALAIVGLLILTTSNSVLNNQVSITESEIVISAVSIAQSLIDEIKTKAFDEVEISGTIDSPNDLTVSLGSESGENVGTPDTSSSQAFASLSVFDDVDDYNGYTRIVNTDIAENFTISCSVQYVSVSNPNNTSGTRTYCKRISVTVTSPFFDTLPSVTMQSAVTY